MARKKKEKRGGNSPRIPNPRNKGLAKKVAGKVAELPVLIPLTIFKGVMKKALEKKGIKPEKKLQDLVKQFHDEVVKRSNLEENFTDIIEAGLKGIVTAILSFFKGLKGKKEKQEKEIAEGKTPSDPLSASEETLLKGAETAVERGKDMAKDEATFQFGTYSPYIIGGIIGLIVLYFIFKK